MLVAECNTWQKRLSGVFLVLGKPPVSHSATQDGQKKIPNRGWPHRMKTLTPGRTNIRLELGLVLLCQQAMPKVTKVSLQTYPCRDPATL